MRDTREPFLGRIKGLLRGNKGSESKPEVSDEAEKQLALEKFRLMGGAGSEGQNPVASYGEGSTMILTDLPNGTVLREKCQSENRPGEDYYIFWYVAGVDSKTGKLKIYDHVRPRLNSRLPYIVNTPTAGCIKREIEPDKAGKIEFEVGQPGIILDLNFRKLPQPHFNQMYKDRSTVVVDVMEFGKRVKQDVKEKQRQPLGQLVPAPESRPI